MHVQVGSHSLRDRIGSIRTQVIIEIKLDCFFLGIYYTIFSGIIMEIRPRCEKPKKSLLTFLFGLLVKE